MSKARIIVIGGGSAGLMAAGQAASAGVSTLLLEKMKRQGRKLRINGKGRCNITNTAKVDPVDDLVWNNKTTGTELRPRLLQLK